MGIGHPELSVSIIHGVYCPLNVVRQLAQMLGWPVEHFAFSHIRCKVPDQRRFSRIASKLLQRGLIVLHCNPLASLGTGSTLLLLIGN